MFPNVYYADLIDSLESTISSITIPNLSCNERKYTRFDLSRFTLLQSLVIGNFCFGFVQQFTINALNKLKIITIGHNSFTETRNSKGNNESKSFHILNCELLELIEIGAYSFCDYAGQFELKNLPSLRSIKIGQNDIFSNNFYYCSFVIQGTRMMLSTKSVDLPKLVTISLGWGTFCESSSTIIERIEKKMT